MSTPVVKVEPRLNAVHRAIYQYLSGRTHGATDEEIALDTGIDGSTLRPRRVELVRMGKVKDSGDTRPTDAGRPAVLWVACDEAAQPQPHHDARSGKMARAKRVIAPLAVAARHTLEQFPNLGDEQMLMVPVRITVRQLRAAIEIMES